MKIPKSYKEISIGQYQQLTKNALAGKNEVEQTIHKLSVLLKLSKDEVKKFSLKQTEVINKKLDWINKGVKNNRIRKYYFIKWKLYKFDLDARNLSAGQYITNMELLKSISKDDETIERNMHLLLAEVIRPLDWRLRVKAEYDTIEVGKIIQQNLSVHKATPLLVFFCNLSKNLTEITRNSLNKKLQATLEKMKEIEEDLKSGVGL
jgi:hypothetical protein